MSANRPVRDFWSYVDKSGECWIWTGAKQPRGYGCIKRAGKWQLAHRYAYELVNGPIPEGLCVCHQCDVPSCVNPSHLWLGTVADNNRDMRDKGRAADNLRPKRKLDEARVLRILADARSTREIADDFGISIKHVQKIRNGSRWAHLRTPLMSGSPVPPPD